MPHRTLIAAAVFFVIAGTSATSRATDLWVNTTDDTVTAGGSCSLRDAVLTASYDICTLGCGCGAGADWIILQGGQNYVITSPLYATGTAAQGSTNMITVVGSYSNPPTIRAGGTGPFQGIVLSAQANTHLYFNLHDLVLIGFQYEALLVGDKTTAGLYHVEVAYNNSAMAIHQNAAIAVGSGGRAYLQETWVHDNTGIRGGGIVMLGSTASVYLNRSTISSNVTSQSGAGVYVSGAFSCVNSHITANRITGGAEYMGGGIYRVPGSPPMSLDGCMVYDNFAATDPNFSPPLP